MQRLFVALTPPPAIIDQTRSAMEGLSGAKWRPDDNLHITLRFIGDVDETTTRDVIAALGEIRHPPIELRLKGVGRFGGNKPRAIWAGVEGGEPLKRLQGQVERACQKAGLAPEGRRFTPHMTLAYIKALTSKKVAVWEAHHNLFTTDSFILDEFELYESHLGNHVSVYEAIAAFPLEG
jgi:2'-5' RNA ligase